MTHRHGALVALLVFGLAACAPPPRLSPEDAAALQKETVEFVAAQPPDVVAEVVAQETRGTLYSQQDPDAVVRGLVTAEPFQAGGIGERGARVRVVQNHPIGVRALAPTPYDMASRIVARLAETERPRVVFVPQWTDATADLAACQPDYGWVFSPPPTPVTNSANVAGTDPEMIGGMAALVAGVVYPEVDRRLGVEGHALVEFIVSREGVPECIRTLTAPSRTTAQAAMAAVRTVRFAPGRQAGQPVRVRFLLPVNFVLN